MRKNIRQAFRSRLADALIPDHVMVVSDEAGAPAAQLPRCDIAWGAERESDDLTLDGEIVYSATLHAVLVWSLPLAVDDALGSLADKMDDAISAARIAVRNDHTLGGRAIDLYYRGSTPTSIDTSADLPVKALTIDFEVQYSD